MKDNGDDPTVRLRAAAAPASGAGTPAPGAPAGAGPAGRPIAERPIAERPIAGGRGAGRQRSRIAALAGVLTVAALGAGGWYLLQPAAPPPVAPAPAPAPAPSPAPARLPAPAPPSLRPAAPDVASGLSPPRAAPGGTAEAVPGMQGMSVAPPSDMSAPLSDASAAKQAAPATPLAAAAPRVPVVTADEATILAAHATALAVYRFAAAPRILVLSFPSMQEQGRMLNRIGAFVEKAGQSHQHVLGEAEFAAALRRTNDTESTYYYGHDYRAADLARFLATAAQDGTTLRPEEVQLAALLRQEGLLQPGAVGALISIPPQSTDPLIDAPARATILHHELSHGLYFTDADYAAYARTFWANGLTEAERAGFRRFLGGQDYDTGIEDLMINETQAYLMHTPDPRYFRPELAGLDRATANRLRRAFWRDMPPGWLKDATATTLGGG